MNLYRDRPGKLSDDQHADALVMADVAAQSVLAMQANAPFDTVAKELEAGANFHLVEHQASAWWPLSSASASEKPSFDSEPMPSAMTRG